VKVEPVVVVAVRVISVPELKVAEQVLPQLIPAGLLVTVPVPVPLFATVRLYVVGVVVNVAVTLLAASSVTKQLPVPVHAPLQPVKVEPVAGVALNATLVPPTKLELHDAPQSIPLGLEPTVPLPVPAFDTLSV
jgi:hypothetical protein